MNLTISNDNIVLTDIRDFDLTHTFECGQCFRWNRVDDYSYLGVAMGKALKIELHDGVVVMYDTSVDDFNDIWQYYFDLPRDYGKIKSRLSEDVVLKNACEYGWGIRILKQDSWECLVSFIISASNHIPRIKKIIQLLCENFGDELSYMGNTYFTFPSADTIAKLTLDDLSVIRAGFRDKYILAAAKMVTGGEINLCGINRLSNADLKKTLMQIPGVGNKVADCILLFAYARHNSFPVDVWLKRIMEHYYFENKQRIDDIQAFSTEKFGELGGFAQQYLFYYGRDNKIGL